MARQRVRRAALAHGEVRGGLPQGLRERRGGALVDPLLCGILQRPTPSLRA
jgi:hypothetical protein